MLYREILALSTDINVLTVEIKMLEQSMKKSMIEHGWQIGQRLTHVKEELKHGGFGKWIEDNFEFSWQYANQFMLFYKQNPNYFSGSKFSKLPSWKHVVESLYLPESIDRQEFIEKPHTIPSTGEEKMVDEMTVRTLIPRVYFFGCWR